jgi:hypothetical protein
MRSALPSSQLRRRSSLQWRGTPTAAPLRRSHHARLLSRAILFMPLACSSTLDRRAAAASCGARRPTWRSFGARRIWGVGKTAGESSSGICLRFFCARHRGAFLSQAGPQVELWMFTLSITFLTRRLTWVPKRRRRPTGSPSLPFIWLIS